ncbi:family 61 glycosyl hydrolase [Mollisia scopiformis]|uniref:lytic cellulose monooxygenase (C4-dehydrogenating) n=1 Tax=Mollisia scopiformis TaxID=149040 RepID=A0A194X260_MOLSC|nr:family 61 glycosyl hydrolase [Mollisia scopiformis]KUJ14286.1 family 61 glycosyl hydrolase [Mollisia scopiformis]
MQLFTILLASASVVHAHYNFNALIYAGSTQATWQQVRKRSDSDSHGPILDVSLLDIRCGKDASTAFAPGILTVAAGDSLGFAVDPDIQHPGPAMGYLAKVPAGKTAANWDGAGAVWFKVWEQGPTALNSNGGRIGLKALNFTIPKATPSGDYIARIEHIGLHAASQKNGAQFYLSCSQVTVTGGGSGTPSPLVSFPGAYSATDPGILIQIYYPVPTTYTIPGPKVWTG